MSPDEKFIQYWEPFSKQDKNMYAIRGAALFTILFGIFKELAYWLIFDRDEYTFRLDVVTINLLIVLVLMYLYKRWEWNKNDTRYRNLTQSKPD